MKVYVHRASQHKKGWKLRFGTQQERPYHLITTIFVEEEDFGKALSIGAVVAAGRFTLMREFNDQPGNLT